MKQQGALVEQLASQLVLGALLNELKRCCGDFELVDHWQQGEFHHDTVFRVLNHASLPGEFLVVATNCNGGIKEVLCFPQMPTRGGLWKSRCPASQEFEGPLPPVLGRVTTHHWFDPCALLGPDARSEVKAEFRERQRGGGWMPMSCPRGLG